MTEFDPPPGARRRFLASLAAFGAGALVPGSVFAQAPHAVSTIEGATVLPRTVIDVHFHYYAPGYLAAWQEYIARTPGGGGMPPAVRGWTPQWAVERMDEAGIRTCVLSLPSTPGVWFGADPAGMQRMSRLCNEFAAKMVRDYPGRFGLFASLPMPDVDGALQEIDHAFGALKADGINLMTSFGNKWPGDPLFDPVFQELNRRKAVVYVHPTAAPCCSKSVPGALPQMIEFPFDTTRTITSLMLTGTIARNRDIRFIFSHGGGTIPFLAARIQETSRGRVPGGVEPTLRSLYYDTAAIANGPAMAALMKLVPIQHILFGSDYPFVKTADGVSGLAKIGLSPAQAQAIARGNAERLLPRLRT